MPGSGSSATGAPSQAELIVDLAEELAAALPDEARYTDPDLEAPEHPFEIDAAALSRVDAALTAMQQMTPAQKSEWFGRFITRYRSSGEISAAAKTPGLVVVEKSLEEGGLLLRHPFVRSAWARCGKRAQLFVNGEAFAMGLASAKTLASHDSLDYTAFVRLDGDARAALDALLRRGHYQLQKPRRSRR